MRPNAGQLARRDPALAALFGVIAAVGTPQNFGADFGDDYGDDYGDDDYGEEFAAEFGAAAAAPKRKPHPKAVAAWQHPKNRRLMLLDPNMGSTKKIERYTFSISTPVIVGTPSAFSITNNPDTTIRPQRVTMAVPTVGFILISEIKVANVSVTVGGVLDAFQFSPLAVGQSLDMPTLSPANRVSVIGNYTGFIAPGLVVGSTFTFAVSFTGPSNLAG